MQRGGREYLRELKKLDKRAERITDKLPSNFRHVGLIASAMPDAAIIHTVRHPLDTALSCYFQNFGSTNTWACDPEAIGVYHRCYRRLIDHWRSLGIEMLDIEYESIVKDQETHSRRVIEHIGLEWEEACLSFHESERVAMTASMDQVRRPMYTSSIARHEKYAEHIAPFAGRWAWMTVFSLSLGLACDHVLAVGFEPVELRHAAVGPGDRHGLDRLLLAQPERHGQFHLREVALRGHDETGLRPLARRDLDGRADRARVHRRRVLETDPQPVVACRLIVAEQQRATVHRGEQHVEIAVPSMSAYAIPRPTTGVARSAMLSSGTSAYADRAFGPRFQKSCAGCS